MDAAATGRQGGAVGTAAAGRRGRKPTDRWQGLAEADRAVVRQFARRHGRRWKAALSVEWERACARMDPRAAGPLLRARGALGPSGLYRLRPSDLVAPPAAPGPDGTTPLVRHTRERVACHNPLPTAAAPADVEADPAALAVALVNAFRRLRYIARDAMVRPYAVPAAGGSLYHGGIMELRGLPVAVAQALVRDGFAHRAQGQNNGPALGTLLEMARHWPDAARLDGYVVSPARDDCRVTVDGVTLDLALLPEGERAAARDRFWTVCLGPDERRDSADGVLRAWWD